MCESAFENVNRKNCRHHSMTKTEMTTKYKKKLNFALLLQLLLLFVGHTRSELLDAAEDSQQLDRFCYPATHQNTRLSCECSNVNAAPWGMRALHIDCSYKDYKAEDLTEVLPLYLDTLDLSWNKLNRVPAFNSKSLHQLNLMHNNVSIITTRNFELLDSLHELYLGWNSIQQLQDQAFAGLPHLKVLNLAHNNLLTLPSQVFGPLLVLATLELSWNRHLNQTVNVELYASYGINSKLDTLRLDACNLNELKLPKSAPLRELSLRRNLFQRVPGQLPVNIQRLDISENLMEQIIPEDTQRLGQVRQLYVEDMSRLQSIAAHALAPLEHLELLSLQNNRKLDYVNGEAFIPEKGNHTLPRLRTVIFRGTLLRTLNETFLPIFDQLTELDLNGVPLHCDCQLVWLKELQVQTNGRCLRPGRVRGMLISSVRSDEFSCERWPRWAYGLIILSLIALCAAGVYLIVMGLRPHRGVTMRRKVGAGSPYARVTIEPNRQENVH